jgi:hypothetical protein
MTYNDNVSGLCERLRGVESETYALGFLHVTYVNPDGPEAANTLERQAAENKRLREALEFYADEDNWFGVYMTGRGPMVDDWSIDGHPYWPDGKPGKTARAALTGED